MSDATAEMVENDLVDDPIEDEATIERRPFDTIDEAAQEMRRFFEGDEQPADAGNEAALEDAERAPEPAAAAEPTFEVEVNGEIRQVPLSQLKAAYTGGDEQPVDPALTEAQMQALSQHSPERQAQDQWVQQVQGYLSSPMPEQPDAALRETDVIEYLTQKDAWSQELLDRQQLQAQLDGVVTQRQAESQQLHQRLLDTEWNALTKHHPGLKDPDHYKAFTADIQEVARHYGFKDQEMLNWWDHRQIRMAADALRTVRAQSAAPDVAKRVATKPPVISQAGRAEPDGAQKRAYKEARSRLRKTGSMRDAAAVFRNFV